MAITVTRSWTDDLQDARERVREARKALEDLSAHLDALAKNPTPGHAHQVSRTAILAKTLVKETCVYGHRAVGDYLGNPANHD